MNTKSEKIPPYKLSQKKCLFFYSEYNKEFSKKGLTFIEILPCILEEDRMPPAIPFDLNPEPSRR